MSKVVQLYAYTSHDIDPNKVLEGAKDKVSKVIVIGEMLGGEEYWFASSTTKRGDMLLLLEEFKQRILNGDFY
jgi:hypothetical protein